MGKLIKKCVTSFRFNSGALHIDHEAVVQRMILHHQRPVRLTVVASVLPAFRGDCPPDAACACFARLMGWLAKLKLRIVRESTLKVDPSFILWALTILTFVCNWSSFFVYFRVVCFHVDFVDIVFFWVFDNSDLLVFLLGMGDAILQLYLEILGRLITIRPQTRTTFPLHRCVVKRQWRGIAHLLVLILLVNAAHQQVLLPLFLALLLAWLYPSEYHISIIFGSCVLRRIRTCNYIKAAIILFFKAGYYLRQVRRKVTARCKRALCATVAILDRWAFILCHCQVCLCICN